MHMYVHVGGVKSQPFTVGFMDSDKDVCYHHSSLYFIRIR